MIRYASILALCLIATPASAGIGGQIAYSVGRDIYLVNPDGSGKRLIYRGATQASIFAISMKKDGGELSFEEVAKGGQTAKLITISYGNSGSATTIRNISGCRFALDTGPDGALLAVNSCDGILKLAPAGSSNFQPVGVPGRVLKVSWMPDGSFIFARLDQIWQATLASPSGSVVRSQDCVQALKAANSASEALVSVGQACADGPRIDRMMVPSGTATHIAAGPDSAYSQDDKCYIFVAPPGRRGTFLLMARIDGTGSSVQFGNSANYGSVDWRSDSVPSTCPMLASNALQFREVK